MIFRSCPTVCPSSSVANLPPNFGHADSHAFPVVPFWSGPPPLPWPGSLIFSLLFFPPTFLLARGVSCGKGPPTDLLVFNTFSSPHRRARAPHFRHHAHRAYLAWAGTFWALFSPCCFRPPPPSPVHLIAADFFLYNAPSRIKPAASVREILFPLRLFFARRPNHFLCSRLDIPHPLCTFPHVIRSPPSGP